MEGATPKCLLYKFVKLPWLSKPIIWHTSTTECLPAFNNCLALSSFNFVIYWCGEIPYIALNNLRKWNLFKHASFEILSSLTGFVRLSSINVLPNNTLLYSSCLVDFRIAGILQS